MDDVLTLGVAPGIDLAYHPRLAAPASTPLLVPALSWLGLDLEPLCDARPVVFSDVRGRGRSSRVDDLEQLALEADVADLERLRAQLETTDARFERVDLMGWSYYGSLVARYALAHPERVRRLVLIGPSPPRAKPWFGRFLDAFARRMDLAALSALEKDKRAGLRERDPLAYGRRVHLLFHRAYVVDGGALERMRSDPCVPPNADADRVNDQSRRVLEKLGDYDWRTELATLTAPTLVVHGAQDPIPQGGSEEWVEALPDARLALLDDVGHMPWLEAPEAFHDVVLPFLQE